MVTGQSLSPESPAFVRGDRMKQKIHKDVNSHRVPGGMGVGESGRQGEQDLNDREKAQCLAAREGPRPGSRGWGWGHTAL